VSDTSNLPGAQPNGQAGAQKPGRNTVIAVRAADLPLHCPPPGDSLWNAHPRVYVPLQPGIESRCPYCGARYLIKPAT